MKKVAKTAEWTSSPHTKFAMLLEKIYMFLWIILSLFLLSNLTVHASPKENYAIEVGTDTAGIFIRRKRKIRLFNVDAQHGERLIQTHFADVTCLISWY